MKKRAVKERGPRYPLAPIEAKAVLELPVGPQWQYEPKWDGFRCLVFRDKTRMRVQSKSGKPLERYFPDVVEAVGGLAAEQFVLDGEIVIPVGGRLSFDELLLRIHPAASRVRLLADAHPAMLVVFDLLSTGRDAALLKRPLAERRVALERFARTYFRGLASVRLSPASRSLAQARRWFRATGGNLDGIIAKRVDMPYRSGERDGMQKFKHRHTADCVVGGFRYGAGSRTIGSLLLGLYDRQGLLHHVGFTAAFTAEERARITKIVAPLRGESGFTGEAPGRPSRWSTGDWVKWEPVRPTHVVEVAYDSFTGGRFRHGTRLLRRRGDKAPEACTFEQVEQGKGSTLALLL